MKMVIVFMLLLLVPIFSASIDRGPYLSCVSENGIIITFESDIPAGGGVRWADEAYFDVHSSFEHDTSVSDFLSHHKFELNALNPWTKYYYQVYVDGDESDTFHFWTAPDTVVPFSFVAYGDCRTNQSEHRTVADAASSFEPHLVFNSGDLITDGNSWYGAWEWNQFFDAIENLGGNAPYYPAVGNHEDEVDEFFRPLFELPGNEQWYSFDYANCHFVVLNNNADISTGSEQYNFVADDLAAADGNYDFIFVIFHRPPYTCGTEHGNHTDTQTYLCPLFVAHNVAMVFNGHNHDYERNYVDGVYYIVTGGGGAPLYPVSPEVWTIYAESCYHFCLIEVIGDSLHFTARYDDGTVFDEFSMNSDLSVSEKNYNEQLFKIITKPEPFNSSVMIETSSSLYNIKNVSIYDLRGNVVFEKSFDLSASSREERVSNKGAVRRIIWTPERNVASGIYLVRAVLIGSDASLICTKKVVYLR
ncbi:hypothetical protein DRQ26_01260 [bacterium]|nr:MAG: hypothetical protein DRQ26_01260 [bacterium]